MSSNRFQTVPVTLTCLTMILAVNLLAAEEKPELQESLPQRFFYNDDGDRLVFLLNGPFHERQLQYPVDALAGTGVTTLVFCANFGSDQAYYPSKVASSLGWREVESTGKNKRFTYFNRIHEVGNLIKNRKIDPLGIVMQRADTQGLEFAPSLRMNDTHFLNKVPPTEHPSTGEFWMNNQDLTIDGGALDFSHKKVRDYRMGQIIELINGYARNGFEMDFSRQPKVFPDGKGRHGMNLITEMVKQTRLRLDAKSQRDGQPRFLIIRVPHTLELCQHYGFDVGGWMAHNLVDYIVPASPDRYFQFDIPLDQFVDLAHQTDSRCRVISGTDSYRATPSMYRAAMSNYYAMGQQDTYLFNFFAARAEQRNYYPFRDEDYALLRDLKSTITLWGRPKHFMSAGWFPGQSIDVTKEGDTHETVIYIGEDLQLCHNEHILKNARLQMVIDAAHTDDRFSFQLNGIDLDNHNLNRNGSIFAFDVRNQLPKRGWNTVSVICTKLSDDSRPVIRQTELFTDYDLTGIYETEPSPN